VSAQVVDAFAKINLGLAITGQREDGFHEIVTLLQTVALRDRITVEAADDDAEDDRLIVTPPDTGTPAGPDNLVATALRALRAVTGGGAVRVALEKTIPAAAGLGGASSDAAASLLAGRALWDPDLPDADLARIAADLGSDVPFFLGGGAALATGRGELLDSLPSLRGDWVLLVLPVLAEPIPRKTATLYGLLGAGDRSSGAAVREQADRLRAGQPPDPALLGNAFERPLLALRPELRAVGEAMRRAGAPFVAVSGAGPAHYTIVRSGREGRRLAARVRVQLGTAATVEVVAAVAERPVVRRSDVLPEWFVAAAAGTD